MDTRIGSAACTHSPARAIVPLGGREAPEVRVTACGVRLTIFAVMEVSMPPEGGASGWRPTDAERTQRGRVVDDAGRRKRTNYRVEPRARASSAASCTQSAIGWSTVFASRWVAAQGGGGTRNVT